MSNFWFEKTAPVQANHLRRTPLREVLPESADFALYEKRSVVAQRLRALPVEAIARGYLIGSGWKDYQRSGAVCGIALPSVCVRPNNCRPRFSRHRPKRRGAHDENIGFDRCVELLGGELAEAVRAATLAIYRFAVSDSLPSAAF